jgi:hypothetical protein
MTQQVFQIRLHDRESEECIGEVLEWPGLPVVGMAIVCSDGVWRVEDLQVMSVSPGSIAARNGDPVLVSAIVSRGEGIFRT